VTAQTSFGVRFAEKWTETYTRGLPGSSGDRRRKEIESDIWEHLHDPQIATREVLGRSLRGIPADVWWRYRTLLESRGTRERNQGMFRNLKRNWWPTLVVVQAILTAAAVVGVMIVAPDQQGSGVAPFRVITGVTGLVSVALLVVGLIVLDRNRRAGSWMIAIGSVPTLLSLLALNPVALLAVATITGGLWTGNLAFTTRPTGIDPDHPTAHVAPNEGTRWYRWLITAVVLFLGGFGTLMLADVLYPSEQDASLIGGLLFFTWLLSWAAAAATAAIGIALGSMRLVSRHRTRTA
jgi:hypothetical protein